MNKINSVLKEVLERVEPPKEDLDFIDKSLKEFLEEIKKRIKKSRVKAEIFIGGSFAKKTVIKKDYYDVDVFIRFDKKYKNTELSKLTKNLLKGIKNVSKIHGSRDYFRIQYGPSFFIELVPVRKVSSPKEAENITDLSYSHVNYIKRKVKSEKILDDIKIAKAFCYATDCYGAESYINGFSGYGLELLVYHYGSFLKFLKAMIKIDKEKEIIDIEKHHKKKDILIDLNAAKLISPIILIDPTYKQRNALAALSEKTFFKFQKAAKKFLKKPSIKDFEITKLDLNKEKSKAKKMKLDFVSIKASTKKQRGDIAGSKLLKFYHHIVRQISKYFDIKSQGFEYDGEKSAIYYFSVKSKKQLVIVGPFAKDKKSVAAFKKRHKHIAIKKGRVQALEKIIFSVKEFVSKWKLKNANRLKEMSVSNLKIN